MSLFSAFVYVDIYNTFLKILAISSTEIQIAQQFLAFFQNFWPFPKKCQVETLQITVLCKVLQIEEVKIIYEEKRFETVF